MVFTAFPLRHDWPLPCGERCLRHLLRGSPGEDNPPVSSLAFPSRFASQLKRFNHQCFTNSVAYSHPIVKMFCRQFAIRHFAEKANCFLHKA